MSRKQLHLVSDLQLCGYSQAMSLLLSFARCCSLATHLLNIDTPVALPGCQGLPSSCISQHWLYCWQWLPSTLMRILIASLCAGSFYNGNNQPYTTPGAYITP